MYPLGIKDIVSLIRDIKNIRCIEQLTLTTNGVLLYEMAKDLYEAGIDAINVSLDTLSRKKFLKNAISVFGLYGGFSGVSDNLV